MTLTKQTIIYYLLFCLDTDTLEKQKQKIIESRNNSQVIKLSTIIKLKAFDELT